MTRLGRTKALEKLLISNYDVNKSADVFGNNVLHLAARWGDKAMIDSVVSLSASPCLYERENHLGFTCLEEGADANNFAAVRRYYSMHTHKHSLHLLIRSKSPYTRTKSAHKLNTNPTSHCEPFHTNPPSQLHLLNIPLRLVKFGAIARCALGLAKGVKYWGWLLALAKQQENASQQQLKEYHLQLYPHLPRPR